MVPCHRVTFPNRAVACVLAWRVLAEATKGETLACMSKINPLINMPDPGDIAELRNVIPNVAVDLRLASPLVPKIMDVHQPQT